MIFSSSSFCEIKVWPLSSQNAVFQTSLCVFVFWRIMFNKLLDGFFFNACQTFIISWLFHTDCDSVYRDNASVFSVFSDKHPYWFFQYENELIITASSAHVHHYWVILNLVGLMSYLHLTTTHVTFNQNLLKMYFRLWRKLGIVKYFVWIFAL